MMYHSKLCLPPDETVASGSDGVAGFPEADTTMEDPLMIRLETYSLMSLCKVSLRQSPWLARITRG